MRVHLRRATVIAACLWGIEGRSTHAQPVAQVEYDVISAAIRVIVEREPWAGTPASEAGAEPIRQVVILGAPDPEGPATLMAVEPDSGPAMDGSALSDYAARAGRGSFEMRFSGIGVYHLFPVDGLRAFRERGGWPGFYERYPGAAGLFALFTCGRQRRQHLAACRRGAPDRHPGSRWNIGRTIAGVDASAISAGATATLTLEGGPAHGFSRSVRSPAIGDQQRPDGLCVLCVLCV